MFRRFLFIVSCLLLAALCIQLANSDEKVSSETQVYIQLEQEVAFPVASRGRMPVVVFAHNGASNKEGWGDFPQALAGEGFLTINITWSLNGIEDVEKAVETALIKYAPKADRKKVAFIGGCHGAVKLLTLSGKKNKYQVKTVVALSISEEDPGMIQAIKDTHPPILAIYATRDRYGYAGINKKVAEEILTGPKKVIALDAVPHGNELVVDDETKTEVRKVITDWLKEYLK